MARNNQQNQMATVEQTTGAFLNEVKTSLQVYAVRDYTQQHFISSAMIAIISNEGLQKCMTHDIGKASIINALKMAAGTGLSLNPQEGKSALIMYKKKVNDKWVETAQYQVMKNGLIELALESGKVEFITAETVREKDTFDISKTMNGDQYSFSPARKSRGDIDGFFAAVKMSDGLCHTKYMTAEEVKAHRKQFSEKTSMPEEGYGQKTVLKKLLNNLHISQDIDNAVGGENLHEEIEDVVVIHEKGTSGENLADKLSDKATKDAGTMPEGDNQNADNKGQEQMNLDNGNKGGSVI